MMREEQKLWIGKKANQLELYGIINFANIPNMLPKLEIGMNILCIKAAYFIYIYILINKYN